MKNTIILSIGLLLINFGFTEDNKAKIADPVSSEDSITVFCSSDLYELTNTWAREYTTLNPDIKFKVINFSESAGNDYIYSNGKIGFISNEYPEMYNGSGWNAIVGREVIVPVFNSKNPFADEICNQGITTENLALLIKEPGKNTWGSLIGNMDNSSVNIYLLGDNSVNKWIAGNINGNSETKKISKTDNARELIAKVKNDIYSIGFVKLANIIDLNNSGLAENIKLLPVDRNGNGKIDYMEGIYEDLNELSRGVWIGKYPSALYSNLYTIATVKPKDKKEVEFLKWILVDGQKFLEDFGYSDLLLSERQSKIALLDTSELSLMSLNEKPAITRSLLLIFASIACVTVISFSIIRLRRGRETVPLVRKSSRQQVFDEQFVDVPMGLYYDKTHTWAYMEKDGLVRIGIDDFLQHITGPLTRVKMKNNGDKIRKGKPVLSIVQDGKQLNIYAPISGTIKEHNRLLDTDSSLINSSPYNDGWVYRIDPTNWIKEIQFLIMGNSYKEWLHGEFARLKEFFSASLNPKSLTYAHVLQDGGALKDSILQELGPEVWEDFQTNFIDI